MTDSRGSVVTSLIAGIAILLEVCPLAAQDPGPLRDAAGVSALAGGLAGATAVGLVCAWRRRLLRRQVLARERRLQRERRRRSRAEARVRRLERALASLGHDIRTPVSAVLGMTTLLLDSPLDDDQRAWVGAGRASAAAIAAVSERILDDVRVNAGQVRVRPQRVSASGLANAAAASLSPQATEKQVSLCVQVPQPDTDLLTDPVLAGRVLVNLVANAVAFTPSGGRIDVRVECAHAPDRAEGGDGAGGWMAFHVCDTGIGISTADQQRLFRRFTRLRQACGGGESGLGLGLSISRSLAARLGGSLTVQSAPGRGSMFTLRLPIDGASSRS